MKLAIALVLSLAIAACTTTGGTTTPAQTVFQIESGFNAALNVAVAYKNLPACGQPTSPTLCSRADVVAKLRDAANSAQAALAAAQNTVRNPGAGANADTAVFAAQQALQALTSITATLNIK